MFGALHFIFNQLGLADLPNLLDYVVPPAVPEHRPLQLSGGLRPNSLEELEHHYDDGTLAVTQVVANYAFPRYWEIATAHLRRNTDSRFATTFRIHPHAASEAVAISQITHLSTLLDQLVRRAWRSRP